ncbi:MAG: ABC transporter permease subunit [Candidatus Micrarchaeaceae archaeon]
MLGYVWQLLIDTSFSWVRMFIALGFSILIGLAVGIYAATSSRAEKAIIPVVDILQTLPILAFFPFVIYVVVATLPGYIGINAAVIFLIITSMLWNIIFGVYEAVRSLPKEFHDLADLYGMSVKDKLFKIFVPASMPKVMEQSTLSWAIGLFYLVTSEIFSTSNANYAVKHGIGVALTNLAIGGNFAEYITGILIFVAFVIATRLLFFAPLERYVNRYNSMGKGGSIVQHARAMLKRLNVAHGLASHVPRRRRAAVHQQYRRQAAPAIRGSARKRTAYIAYAIVALLAIAILAANQNLMHDEIIVLASLAASFVRVWFAFIIIVVVAVPLSVYMLFMSKRAGWYVLLFQIIASIPATILLPLIVMSLKNAPMHNELVAFSIFFLSGIWYVVFSILSQRAYIPQSIFEVKRIFGIKGKQAWKKIYIYAVLPGLLTGAVTGIAAEWNASIVAEYFTSTAIGNGAVITSVSVGIGKLLDVSLDSGNMLLMVLGLINLTVMIIIINRFVWKRFYNKVESVYK